MGGNQVIGLHQSELPINTGAAFSREARRQAGGVRRPVARKCCALSGQLISFAYKFLTLGVEHGAVAVARVIQFRQAACHARPLGIDLGNAVQVSQSTRGQGL